MMRAFTITTATNTVVLDAKRAAKSSFTVTNVGRRPLKARAEVKAQGAAKPAWFTVEGETEREMGIDATQRFSVALAVPPGVAAGSYSFRFDVVSVANPDDDFAEGPVVSFEVAAAPAGKPFPWWIPVVALVVIGLGVGLWWRISGDGETTPPPPPPPAPPIAVEVFTKTSRALPHPEVRVEVGNLYRLIGGGCRSDWTLHGHLLTASYPDGNAWVCQAKDHGEPESATVSAFALAVPASLGLDVRIRESTGARDAHPTARAPVEPGYVLIGGGCRDNWRSAEPGNLLVDSYPASDAWVCEGKDHVSSSPATITAFAIGVKSDQYSVIVRDSLSAKAPHPHALASVQAPGTALVGGGCDVTYGGDGNMLTASFPEFEAGGWQCRAKDHGKPDPGTVRAFAIGLRPKQP
jgi:hypothetical protein